MKRNLINFFTVLSICILIGSCGEDTQITEKEPGSVSSPTLDVDEARTAKCIDPAIISLTNMITSGVSYLETACGIYCDAYGKMPENLSDLLDGFLLVWPGNVNDGKPLTIIKSPPDPSNPAQRGSIYYERTGNYEAYIYYVDVDYRDSTPGNIIWTIGKFRIYSIFAEYARDSENPSKWSGAKSLENLSPDERVKRKYAFNTHTCLTSIIFNCFQRNGKLDESFIDSISNGRYHLIDTGL